MKDNWTDFEKYVFAQFESLDKKVSKISNRMSRLEGRSAAIGAIMGLLAGPLGDWVMRLLKKG